MYKNLNIKNLNIQIFDTIRTSYNMFFYLRNKKKFKNFTDKMYINLNHTIIYISKKYIFIKITSALNLACYKKIWMTPRKKCQRLKSTGA